MEFRGYSLWDPGAFPKPPLSGSITWRVTQPWTLPMDEKEREAMDRAQQMIEQLRARQAGERRE